MPAVTKFFLALLVGAFVCAPLAAQTYYDITLQASPAGAAASAILTAHDGVITGGGVSSPRSH